MLIVIAFTNDAGLCTHDDNDSNASWEVGAASQSSRNNGGQSIIHGKILIVFRAVNGCLILSWFMFCFQVWLIV